MRYFLFLSLFFLMSSCKIASPTFKNIGQWQITQLSTSSVTIENTAFFNNPNSINGLKLNTVAIDVMANSKKIGTITNPNGNIIIPSNADFNIPLSLNINPSDLVSGIGDLIGIALGKTVDVRCIGSINVGYMMLSKRVAIDQTVPLDISKIKL